jgi:hypothetical protein
MIEILIQAASCVGLFLFLTIIGPLMMLLAVLLVPIYSFIDKITSYERDSIFAFGKIPTYLIGGFGAGFVTIYFSVWSTLHEYIPFWFYYILIAWVS